jgi:hypothetical protein
MPPSSRPPRSQHSGTPSQRRMTAREYRSLFRVNPRPQGSSRPSESHVAPTHAPRATEREDTGRTYRPHLPYWQEGMVGTHQPPPPPAADQPGPSRWGQPLSPDCSGYLEGIYWPESPINAIPLRTILPEDFEEDP